jgi:hypothetical protein
LRHHDTHLPHVPQAWLLFDNIDIDLDDVQEIRIIPPKGETSAACINLHGTPLNAFPPSAGSRVDAVEIAGAMSGCSFEDLLFGPGAGADSPHEYSFGQDCGFGVGQELLPELDLELELCPVEKTFGSPSADVFVGALEEGEVPQTPSFLHFDMPTSPLEATSPAPLSMPSTYPQRQSESNAVDTVELFDDNDISYAPAIASPRSPDADAFLFPDDSPVSRPEAFSTPGSVRRTFFGSASRTPDYASLLLSPNTLDESLDTRSPLTPGAHGLFSPFTASLTNTYSTTSPTSPVPALFAITVTPAPMRRFMPRPPSAPRRSPSRSPLLMSPARYLRTTPLSNAKVGGTLGTPNVDAFSPMTPAPSPTPVGDISVLDNWTVRARSTNFFPQTLQFSFLHNTPILLTFKRLLD